MTPMPRSDVLLRRGARISKGILGRTCLPDTADVPTARYGSERDPNSILFGAIVLRLPSARHVAQHGIGRPALIRRLGMTGSGAGGS